MYAYESSINMYILSSRMVDFCTWTVTTTTGTSSITSCDLHGRPRCAVGELFSPGGDGGMSLVWGVEQWENHRKIVV